MCVIRIREAIPKKKVTKLRTFSVPPLAPPPHLRTLMGVFLAALAALYLPLLTESLPL